MIDVWSCKVVAWEMDEREDPAIDADLVSRACLRERRLMPIFPELTGPQQDKVIQTIRSLLPESCHKESIKKYRAAA